MLLPYGLMGFSICNEPTHCGMLDKNRWSMCAQHPEDEALLKIQGASI